jgi:glycosyltransferase involved in cell wall biosynthesis
LRILLLHNRYQQPGGEDTVVAREQHLLASRGHDIFLHAVSNDTITTMAGRLRAAWQAPYSSSARRHVAHTVQTFRPDVVHVHNFFPLLSPSIYDACRAARVPVVQTLHNYRLLCVNALLLRAGRVCEDCLGKAAPWPGVLHACYRGSRVASGAVAAMLTLHRGLRTWTEKVDVYIALTDFCREKFIQGGLPAEKIVIKPNFVHPDPGVRDGQGSYALFVGRLSPEKGVHTLLRAWEHLGKLIPLKIVGAGPLATEVEATTRRTPGVEWLGQQSPERVLNVMKGARFLVFPSVYYESFPMVIAEAYATGLPIVASNLGSMASLVVSGRTGLLFERDDAGDLAAKASWLWSHHREREVMGRGARLEYEREYAAERNYQMLMDIYALARSYRTDRSAETLDRSGAAMPSELEARVRSEAP